VCKFAKLKVLKSGRKEKFKANMELALRTLVDFNLFTNVIFFLLVLAGVWGVLWWSIENFMSILQITRSLLTPLFQPQEKKSLVEKYGKWAGTRRQRATKFTCICVFALIFTQLLLKTRQ
jgi:hypothetical protein